MPPNTATNPTPATRAELDAIVRRLELVTDKLTEIVKEMAVDKVHNQVRDDAIKQLQDETKSLKTEISRIKERITYFTGGAIALLTAMQMLAKKLGLY